MRTDAYGGLGVTAGQNIRPEHSVRAEGNRQLHERADTQFITGGVWRLHTGQAIGMLAGAVAPGDGDTGLQLIAAKGEI